MLRERIVLYDSDKEYLEHFIRYFENDHDSPLKIIGFSEKELFLEFLNQNDIDILLISEENLQDIHMEFDRKRIILLIEEPDIESIDGIKVLYKFQRIENIIRYIINVYAENMPEKNVIKIKGEARAKIIGIYSPVKRCGKTALSMELAEHLTKHGKVLMMNMEEYSALRTDTEEEMVYDLSDLLYFYMQNSWSFELKLKVVMQCLRGFDYIPPVKNGDELRGITTEQWRGLITEIARVSDYQMIILDISDIVSNILQLLHMCDYVIMPYMSDEISSGKMTEFEKELSILDEKELLQVYRLSMDGVINQTYDNACLKANVGRLIEEGGVLRQDGGKYGY